MRRTIACASLILCLSCVTSAPLTATKELPAAAAPNREPSVTAPGPLQVAQAEVRRAGGIDPLLRALREGDSHTRRMAVRALGRSGGERAVDALLSALATSQGLERVAVVASLGLAGNGRAADPLSKLLAPGADQALQVAVLDALGRIGSTTNLTVMVNALTSESPMVRSQAALSLGLFGRRQLALNASAVEALTKVPPLDPAFAYGVAYALAREHQPAPDEKAVARLRELSGHADAEVRALSLSGLTRREVVADALAGEKLDDPDARVRVQAVRNLLQKAATAKERARVVSWLKARVQGMIAAPENLAQAELVAELEALEALRQHGKERAVAVPLRAASAALRKVSSESLGAQVNLSALRCQLATVHDADHALMLCEAERGMDRHLLLGAALQVAPSEVALAKFADEDPRVRAAALLRALSLTPVAEAAWGQVGKSLASPHPAEAGSVVEALMAHLTESGRFMAEATARTARELDAAHPELELLVGLFGLLSATKDKQYATLCERGLSASNRTLRKSALDCLSAIDVRSAAGEVASLEPEVMLIHVERSISLQLETTKGNLTIDLDPGIAAWSVSAVVKLAREGFYDGLPFHRVVGDFVVQGGDPTGSGWGGPRGLSLPAEPSVAALGGTFERGAVGIADAGPDTGGSQFFIMHSRAAHLEGRYTQLGRVTAGDEVIDRLIIGDRVLRARVKDSAQ